MLAEHGKVEVVGEADHVPAAVDLIRHERPDAVFLDIGLPEQTGFDILRRLPSRPAIVVVTACADHAVRAFNENVVDYLLKPVFPSRLAEAVQRLEKMLALAARSDPGEDRTIRLRTAKRIQVVPTNRLVAVCAEGDFARILIEQQAPILVLQPLKHLERELPAPPFLRLSRSLIINSRRIREVRSSLGGRGQVSLDGISEALQLGRTATVRLRTWAASC
ncbi:MAG TPA: LytTR family DNA-binding domain-containing protein [Geminicoccus sp.]|uniref:LytR/AlgR family response regulator transcription factor n=1 Tax=Geminicoccus sp. TaxID=2024832 RepID=UPI002E2F969E|nr:LytTR family DNA-binding domain-containing protein [Geminicoccus sp.]HEX2528866.1 LytTR family DNA-binding domain-containing protein [Geminicoccus sp.]